MSAKVAMLRHWRVKWRTAYSVHVCQSELSRAACCIVDPRPLYGIVLWVTDDSLGRARQAYQVG